MAANSIWENMEKDDIINEIQLMINYPDNQSVFVVVEGEDDIAFFPDLLSPDVELVESFSGKEGVKEIVMHFSKPQVIGVCDRDYQQSATEPRIFYYDNSCLEMMLIVSDVVMNRLRSGFYRGSLSSQELRQTILKELKWLSVFRKLNSHNGWGVNFKGFPINNVIKNERFQLVEAENTINKRSKDYITNHPTEYAQVKSEWQTYPDTVADLLLITQGHDFINAFKAFCTVQGRRAPAQDAVACSLRCAYRMDDFKTTALYRDLKAYEERCHLQILSA